MRISLLEATTVRNLSSRESSPLLALGAALGACTMMRPGGGASPPGAPASPSFARTVSQTELGGSGGSGGSLSSVDQQGAQSRSAARSRRARWPTSRSLVAPLLVVACALCALAALFLRVGPRLTYVVVIDGGSQGSRVHVYSLAIPPRGMPTVHAREAVMRAKPGLSAFHDDPTSAGASLAPLLAFAREHIPDSALAATPALLMATAGLRSVDPPAASAILRSCRAALADSPFRFRDEWAEVLPGAREGLYAWIAANYAAGTLGAAPADTLGVIELGGASMQITFRPERKPPEEFRVELVAARRKWSVYTHSALGLGQEAAREAHEAALLASVPQDGSRTVPDPCTPRGYEEETGSNGDSETRSLPHPPHSGVRLEPRGNFTACRAAVGRLIGVEGLCAHARCGVGGSYLPPLRGRFLATENFHHAARFFRLPERATVADVAAAGEALCGAEWDDITRDRPETRARELLRYCFSASLIVATLHDAMGVPLRDESAVTFGDEVNGVPVDWAMGAAIAFAATSEEVGAGKGGDGDGGATGRRAAATATALAAFAAILLVVAARLFELGTRRRAQLRLGELRVRRSLGMPSKGGVTSPTRGGAKETAFNAKGH